jgi:predicted Zn-dependent peptidase
MKKLRNLGLIAAFVLFIASCAITGSKAYTTKQATDKNGYNYEYVENDPTNARIYTLDNGLKVYLTDYEDKPRIQTYIAVAAGSKNDPADATGLAHYLEHILFKGTSKFGTQDWEKEKPLLDSIEGMFEHYGTITDAAERKAYYQLIDQVSNEAASFAIANEYDKMIAELGATGTNAYTANERTVYVNEIPSNSLEKWLAVEGERFLEVVPRLFHTELEAVYEEKNRTLDSDMRQAWEKIYAALFQKHQYGTQTGIGTIEHLKSPSIIEIKQFFDKYYRPNNVAICLSGDLDFEEAIQLVDSNFGKWEAKEFEPFRPAVEEPITTIREHNVYGPQGESVFVGFRFPGKNTKDAKLLTVTDMLLSNGGEAGLLNINLGTSQKVIGPWSYPDMMNDYSAHMLSATPRQGQPLEEVKDLLLAQIDSIKEGKFEDWLIEAVITELKKDFTRGLGSNQSRADMFVQSYTSNQTWQESLESINELNSITKKDVMEFAKKNYTADNYVIVYKRFGENPDKQNVEKPEINPVPVNREAISTFREGIQKITSSEITPVFMDFEKDIKMSSIKGNLPMYYKENIENGLFDLYYVFEMGNLNDAKTALAVDYLKYLGTDKYAAEQFQLEMYKLGCEFNVFSSDKQIWVSLSGLDENMGKSMDLFEELLANCIPNNDALANMIMDIQKNREDAKKDKGTILMDGMASYAKYGATNPFSHQLSIKELNTLTGAELVDKVHALTQYEHKVLYYGPRKESDVTKVISQKHILPANMTAVPEMPNFEELSTASPTVYWVDYDMVQAEVILLSKQEAFDKTLSPKVRLYNEYFGGGMGSIVFQEMRESRALAYSVYSRYREAREAGKSNYVMAYIGTQSDKLRQALNDMVDLMYNMPESNPAFEDAKSAIISNMRTKRTTKSSILFSYLSAQKKGLDYDQRKDIFEGVQNLSLKDVVVFQESNIKDRPFVICVIGSKDKLDFDALKQYGELKQLSLEDIFGY